MKEVNIKELEIADVMIIWWGLFWRAIVIGIGSMLAGGIAGGIFGGIFGVVASLTGGSLETILSIARAGGMVLGVVISMYFFYLYLCWLLKSKFGKYRLVLASEESSLIS
jgi:hypothetical protein